MARATVERGVLDVFFRVHAERGPVVLDFFGQHAGQIAAASDVVARALEREKVEVVIAAARIATDELGERLSAHEAERGHFRQSLALFRDAREDDQPWVDG